MTDNISNLPKIQEPLVQLLVDSALGKSYQQRRALCLAINVMESDLDFLEGVTEKSFALQLVNYLFKVDNKTSIQLLFEELEKVLKEDKKKELLNLKDKIKCEEYKAKTRYAYDNFGQLSFQEINAQIDEKEKKDRKGICQKVEESWIEGFLNPSLGLNTRNLSMPVPDLDNRVFDLNESYETLQKTQTLEEIGQGQGRTLLILGKPGAGKTIALLHLAKRLLEYSKNNSYPAMPVIFNLSSWAEEQKDIVDWLIDELRDKYQVPKSLSEKWISGEQLILLLDGLDEVKEENHRNNCVSKLNSFLSLFHRTEVAICCRLEEYEALPNHLEISSALCLQPYPLEQVYQYLKQVGGSLGGLQELLRSDAELENFARTPLILYFMSATYSGKSLEYLKTRLQSTSDRNGVLFNDYIDCQLKKGAKSEYSKDDVLRWLNWLAKKMSQSVFKIEEIQPQFLPSKNDEIIYRIATSLTLGALLGLIAGLYFIYFYTAFPNNKPLPEIKILIQLIAIGLLSGLISGVIVGLLSLRLRYLQSSRLIKGLISGTMFALSISFFDYFIYHQQIQITPIYLSGIFGGAIFSSIDASIKPVETIELDFNKMLKYITFFGIFGGGFSSIKIYIENPENFFTDKIYYSVYAIIIFMLVGLFVGGFRVRKNSIDLKKAVPNQGIKRSLIYTLITFCSLFFSAMFAVWGMDFSFDFNPVIICLGLAVALLGGLGANESSGVVCLQHFTLRQMLYKKGCIPKNYEEFLYFVSVRRLMNKIGGSYIFLHRMLLEHFKADEIGTR